MWLQMNRSHKVISEAPPLRTTLSGPGLLTTSGAARPRSLWLVQGVMSSWGEMPLCKGVLPAGGSEASLPRGVLPCVGCCAPRRAEQEAGLQVDDVRYSQSDCLAFLCCICGVSMREGISALLLCHFIAFFFFPPVGATFCGGWTTGHEDCQGPGGPQLGPSICTSSRASGSRFQGALIDPPSLPSPELPSHWLALRNSRVP